MCIVREKKSHAVFIDRKGGTAVALARYQQRQKELRRKLREDEKFFRDSAQLSINVLSVVPVYIMLEQYGWKRIRLSRFIRRYATIIADIASKKVTPDSLADEIYQQTGIKYDDGNWWDTKTKESVRK